MTQYRRANANLAQFKALIKSYDTQINVIFFPANAAYPDSFTTTIEIKERDKITTHILHTQKNELRRFKNISALTNALQLDHTSPAINLLISA